jgi:hypothetical protein
VRELVPVSLVDVKRYVNEHHQHNEAPTSWKFGVGLAEDGVLVGVCAVGRASGRGIDQYLDVEVTRVCVAEKGMHQNACSTLYGAACRAAAALGYRTAYTYTLAGEDAASVRAAGFVLDADLPARASWSNASRPRYDQTLFGDRKRPTGPKRRWRRDLRARVPA